MSTAPSESKTPRALRPFRVPQYRILATALTMSLLGSGIWLVSVVFQVTALGGGPSELSLVSASGALALILAVLFGGVAADRIPQKRILVVTESTKVLVMGVVGVLAFSGSLELWHLVVAGFVLGLADGAFYPAYSALLPSVLPHDDLLAANGVEGVLRPAVLQATGPALASAAIAIASPALGFSIAAVAQLLAVGALVWLRTTAVRREVEAGQHPVWAVLTDLRDGFVFMARTPWLLATLLFALLLVLVIMGPIEVLVPFAVTRQTGGGAGSFALVLAAYGLGGAIGSIVVASRRLPRRYLTVMMLGWGLGSAPLVVLGITNQLWVMALAVFIVGFTFAASTVIWGTLLQRRVPPAMLGRVSSLDFFISLAFMPISMAIAGPVGEAIGFAPTFLVAGTVPVLITIVALFVARMPRDEIANPLDPVNPPDPANPLDAADRPVSA